MNTENEAVDKLTNGVKLVGESVIPGASLMMDGKLIHGAAHAIVGFGARALLGVTGVVLVAANSYSKSLTDKNLWQHAVETFNNGKENFGNEFSKVKGSSQKMFNGSREKATPSSLAAIAVEPSAGKDTETETDTKTEAGTTVEAPVENLKASTVKRDSTTTPKETHKKNTKASSSHFQA